MNLFQKKNKNETLEALFLKQEERQSAQWNEAMEMMQKILQKQKKQDSVIEGIYETIEEHTDAFSEYKEKKSKEDKLLAFIMEYDEGMYQMRKMLQVAKVEETGWESSVEQIRKQLKAKVLEVGLVCMDETGERVNYQLQELVGVVPTNQQELHGIIQEIIVPGWIYQGELLKKAKVMAYKYEGDTQE